MGLIWINNGINNGITGWLVWICFFLGNVIISTDELSIIFQRGRRKTTNQSWLVGYEGVYNQINGTSSVGWEILSEWINYI
jgi:hypothetical protein